MNVRIVFAPAFHANQDSNRLRAEIQARHSCWFSTLFWRVATVDDGAQRRRSAGGRQAVLDLHRTDRFPDAPGTASISSCCVKARTALADPSFATGRAGGTAQSTAEFKMAGSFASAVVARFGGS